MPALRKAPGGRAGKLRERGFWGNAGAKAPALQKPSGPRKPRERPGMEKARARGEILRRPRGLLRMTTAVVRGGVICGGWLRGRVRDRGATREDAIARARIRAGSRSCCRRPD